MRQGALTTRSAWMRACTFVLATPSMLLFAHATAETARANPAETAKNTATAIAPSSAGPQDPMSSWHFQATYGISSADVEVPVWKTDTDPAQQEQISTTGLLTQARYSHALEHEVNKNQMFRWGFSLLSSQTITGSGWLSGLTKDSKAPAWRSWGVGGDFFLVRRFSPACDFDAGVQVDYYLSGNSTIRSSISSGAVNPPPSRLEQKNGWRVAFSGGISGLYLDPVGLIFRLSGFVSQATFKGHSQPLRAHGVQIQIGADLALGRGGS